MEKKNNTKNVNTQISIFNKYRYNFYPKLQICADIISGTLYSVFVFIITYWSHLKHNFYSCNFLHFVEIVLILCILTILGIKRTLYSFYMNNFTFLSIPEVNIHGSLG